MKQGQTARIVLTKGFIQPIIPYASFLKDQLDALAKTNFPANNAIEFQTIDILLTGENQDISNNFNFTNVESYDFVGEDRLPLGLVASIIDVDNDDFALGKVSDPIYLQFSETGDPVVVDPEPPTDVVVDDPVILSNVVVEAEGITNITGYRIEDNSIASQGKLLSLVGGDSNEIASASFDFSGATGNYNVILGVYDENDGQATFEVTQEGNLIGNIALNADLDGNAISSDTQVTQVVANNISINQGDNFTITGFENGNEHARFDYIKFELIEDSNPDVVDPIITPEDINTPEVDVPDTTNPTQLIRLEAEEANVITQYRTESISGASQGNVLSFIGDNTNETGNASFIFDNPAGTYDVVLATYDENDGAASFDVSLNGSQIGGLLLNDDLGSSVGNTQTAISEAVALGVSLAPGDILTVTGFENGNEHARFDYLEFIPQVI